MNINWDAKLYSYGYLLTDKEGIQNIPIGLDWSKWNYHKVSGYNLYVHESENAYVYRNGGRSFVLIGHAYNPFTMENNEIRILEALSECYKEKNTYRDYFDQLTGLFVYFIIEGNRIVAACDCAGLMGAYYGIIKETIYFSSHAQMIAELTGINEDPYVTALKKSKTFRLYGLYLPSDYSPYTEVKRILPNVEVFITDYHIRLKRFYPRKQYSVDRDYNGIVKRVGELLHNNMVLISQKWEEPAVSLTGGIDSKTTLACSSDVQDKFLYYSYASIPRELTDANAAKEICRELGLHHEIYTVYSDKSAYSEYDDADKLIERQYGFLGKANENDVCKRICLAKVFHSDVEVKSWVSEIARASRYTKYNKEKLPAKMTPRMLTSMYKIFIYDRVNAIRTDKIFAQYLNATGLKKAIAKTRYPWSEFFVWEIVFGGWGGLALSCEHKTSNYITVPYNNRAIIDLMLRTPLPKRKTDQLHRDIMDYMDPRVNKTGIHVVNGNETKFREILEGLYFDIHSHIPF